MKHLKTTILFVAAVFLTAGSLHADTGKPDQETTMEKLEKQWSETMETLGSYTADQREQALESGRETLDAMDERIERMETWMSRNWESLSEAARDQKMQTLNAMREQRRKVAEWYGGMKHSSAETWDSVKEGFIQSYDKLQGYYRDAVDSFESGEGENSSEE